MPPQAGPDTLLTDLHVQYIQSLDKQREDLSYYFTEHLRMNGVYWGLTALAFMGRMHALPKDDMIQWVMSCWNDDVVVLSLQDPSRGSFAGDAWKEQDSRFSYCAVSILSLLGRLEALEPTRDKTIEFIRNCRNFDGGFGMVEGAESHAAYALAILDRLDLVDSDTLCWWLCERQLANGGLNGRPEKLEDVRCGSPLSRFFRLLTIEGASEQVCYSWWAVATLAILGRSHWIDGKKLTGFILSAQASPFSRTQDSSPSIQSTACPSR
ncbi:SPOSA6832_04750, partial [Sporobolomyces salmonicolor]